MKRHFLFDLDGTLTQSHTGILNSLSYAIDRMNERYPALGIRFDEQLGRSFLGPPLWQSFKTHCGMDTEQTNEAVGLYREYFGERGMFENTLYPGIYELVHALKQSGGTISLATAKYDLYAEQILDHFGLLGCFSFISGSTKEGNRIEKDEIIAYALEKTGAPAQTSVMVGDRAGDIIGARANRVTSIGVLYGYGDMEELRRAGADYITESVAALTELLMGDSL